MHPSEVTAVIRPRSVYFGSGAALLFSALALSACGDDGGGGGSAGAAGSAGTGGSGAQGGSAQGGSSGSAQGGSAGSAQGGSGAQGGSSGSAQGGSGAQGGSAGSGAGGTAQGGNGGGVASPGCGLSSPTGVSEDASVMVGGEARSFVLSVPADYDPKTIHQVFFGFHGLNADGKAARNYLKLEATTGKPAIFVYPSSRSSSAGWQMRAGEGDIEFFDEIVNHLITTYCVDIERIFSTGFSHGAMFTNNLTCERIDKLRAIAPIGGSGPWFGASCTGSVPVMLIHGTTDGTVVFPDGEKSRDHWLGENGCGATTQPYDPSPCESYDGCAKPVVFCPFDGGHTVPPFAGQAVRSFFDSQ